MKSQAYIFLYSSIVGHCIEASDYKIIHFQIVQGLVFLDFLTETKVLITACTLFHPSTCAHDDVQEKDVPKKNSSCQFMLGKSESSPAKSSCSRFQAAVWLLCLRMSPGPRSALDWSLLGKRQRKDCHGCLWKRVSAGSSEHAMTVVPTYPLAPP